MDTKYRQYQDYSYQLNADGVHCYDDAQLTVTHKPSGKTKSMIIECALMFGRGFGNWAVNKLVKEFEKELEDNRSIKI